MSSFADYRTFREFGEILDKPTTNITFDDDESNDFVYNFKIGEDQFEVGFSKDSIGFFSQVLMRQTLITEDAYAISLYGPQGYELTGSGKGTEVYGHLILAVKKLISDHVPEGLIFSGTNPRQRLMYASFYNRSLKKAYTQLSASEYLNNNFIQRVSASQNPADKRKATAIREAFELFGQTGYESKVKEQKDFLRKHYLVLKSNIGKIMLYSNYGEADRYSEVVYLVSVNVTGATVYNGGRHQETIPELNELIPIPPYLFEQYKTDIGSVQRNLQEMHRITNAHPWVMDYKIPKFSSSAYDPPPQEPPDYSQ
jgi:hypothetical protein